MARERDVWDAVAAALQATDAFDGVYLWGFDDAAEQGSDSTRAVAIVPNTGAESDLWDDVATGLALVDSTVKLVLMCRDNDKQRRDEDLERLLDVTMNALNGKGLAGATFPQWTKVRSWKWGEPTPPQRTAEAILHYRYEAANVASFDTSE